MLPENVIHKKTVIEWIALELPDEIDSDIRDVLIGCFQESFDYWPDEVVNGGHSRKAIGDPTANQLGGFRRSDPDTSRKAAIVNFPRSGTQRGKALMAVVEAGDHGATASEIEAATGVPFRSLTPRLGELKNGGWVKPSGFTRRGPMGADQDVIIATDKAREWIYRQEKL